MTTKERDIARKHGLALRNPTRPELGWRQTTTFAIPSVTGGRAACTTSRKQPNHTCTKGPDKRSQGPPLLTSNRREPTMTRRRTTTFLAVAAIVALTALAASACGGNGGGATASMLPKGANGQPATVGVANGGLGKILVDSRGRTLYLFQKDSGTKSACFGECANDWPPLRW